MTSVDVVAGPCVMLDKAKLSETGAIAVYLTQEGATRITARDRSGRRPWNSAGQ